MRGWKNSSPELCTPGEPGTLFPAREGEKGSAQKFRLSTMEFFSIRNEKISRKSRKCYHNFTVYDSMVSGFVLDLAKATKPKKVNSMRHSRIINKFANDTIHYESSKFEFISFVQHVTGNDQDYLGESPEWLFRYLRFSKRATVGVCAT